MRKCRSHEQLEVAVENRLKPRQIYRPAPQNKNRTILNILLWLTMAAYPAVSAMRALRSGPLQRLTRAQLSSFDKEGYVLPLQGISSIEAVIDLSPHLLAHQRRGRAPNRVPFRSLATAKAL